MEEKKQHWEILFIKLAPLVEEVCELQIPAGECRQCPCSLRAHAHP